MLVNDDDDDNKEAEVANAESFVQDNMSNYKGQKKQLMGGFGLHRAAKAVQEIIETFQIFLK